MLSCVAVHCASRDSKGCLESRGTEVVVDEVCAECTTGPTPARRVSWIPGAEGAPRLKPETLLWVLECEADGTIRIDMAAVGMG